MPKSQTQKFYEILNDTDKVFGTLIDASMNEPGDELQCGFIWFLGRSAGELEVEDPETRKKLLIEIPEEAYESSPFYAKNSPEKNIKIKILAHLN